MLSRNALSNRCYMLSSHPAHGRKICVIILFCLKCSLQQVSLSLVFSQRHTCRHTCRALLLSLWRYTRSQGGFWGLSVGKFCSTVWLPPHRLVLLQRRIEFNTAQRRNTKGSLNPEATGSFRQFGLLLPRLLQTGNGADLLLSGNVAAAHSSPGFRGSLP